MQSEQYLQYGFVVFLSGSRATYDHKVKARMPYADTLLARLSQPEVPVIAREAKVVDGTAVSSPVFKYASSRTSVDSYQSAYYLTDTLMRKGMLPVFLPETGEVKDLMPLLTKSQREDAKLVIQILCARYIKATKRHPKRNFMVAECDSVDPHMLNMSDSEILAIFGRLPSADEPPAMSFTKLNLVDNKNNDAFIQKDIIRRA